MTTPTSDRPPAGKLLNPAVITEARRRGWPMTPAALADAARLANLELHLPATDAAAKAGIAAITTAQRQAADRAANAATIANIEKEMAR